MTLTTALSIVGGLVLLALIVQGWLATRRAGPRRAEALPPAPDRVEPGLGTGAPAAGENDAEPGFAAGTHAHAAPLRRPARLDALIDAIVPMTLDAPVTGDFLLSHLPPTRRAGTKPFYVEGLDTETGDWQQPQPGRRYGELQAGVQLASRSGALNEIEYSEFVQKLQAFAEATGAMPDFPDMLEVVARARELDALASPLDAQLTVTLRSNHVAWSVGYIQQTAQRHGFLPGSLPGRLVLPGAEDGAPVMLVLSFDSQAALADDAQMAAVRDCTLTLDVPQTEARLEPFPTWHRLTTVLADEMDATAVDDQGQPVTLHAFDAIGQELQQLYAQLEQLGLPAGSPTTRRLFS
ncbi:cell division protein FtsZ [Rubrivivax gelatinosus]|uniref:cell division protein FtsZ n=1 Tax=Rubrivivax gelatinosus TaxID=28068 RepID=UPI0019059E80|nr:cell division protein FtsZ [Rubrivivax gelatinosus]MBK1612006.1 cell division protein FtsZ [Rubrivivax gelatinosus]